MRSGSVVGDPLDGSSTHVRLCSRLADDRSAGAAGMVYAASQAPAVQSLRRRVEAGGALICAGVGSPGHPFLAALLRHLFPTRPILVVVPDLKTQENVHQDLETWLSMNGEPGVEQHDPPGRNQAGLHFHPAWDILPHDDRLPHADVISDRLKTLMALTAADRMGVGALSSESSVVVTSRLKAAQ